MEVLETLAEYVLEKPRFSERAIETARLALMDAIGCAYAALKVPACTKLLGPVVEGAFLPGGARVIGMPGEFDPVRAAFNNGTLIRWLDYNDTWLAKEWGHPSDNLGALLALSDYLCRKRNKKITLQDLLNWQIKAYEIQGVLALSNCFNGIGFDHVILVKIASTAVSVGLLGLSKGQVVDALSHAFLDTGPLRTYRHAPCTGSRKSWAAGDQTARAVFLALLTERGEMGYPEALDAKKWGFSERILPVTLEQKLGSYVMENILFKVKYPAEFHAQTAVEAAIELHMTCPHEQIASIEIETHEAATRIIAKEGPLKNFADRDHCLQYMVAVALLKGSLAASDYEEEAAQDPRIDGLRKLMRVRENPEFTKDYFDPKKRSIASTLKVRMKDGSVFTKCVEYPIGHRLRRDEAKPLLLEKFHQNVGERENVSALFDDPNLSVEEFFNNLL
ncbi:MAG: bifunctional 2-methylcitrate dehydratase/aconitate hydratase [Chlamydiia bacterium]|nr:bifunctional 2-methylcitrate dehydratase/aconitate hydratase [Chlamydiia bacterium]